MPFFLAADYAAVGLDFTVRIKGGLALTPRAVCELDVLVGIPAFCSPFELLNKVQSIWPKAGGLSDLNAVERPSAIAPLGTACATSSKCAWMSGAGCAAAPPEVYCF